MAENTGGRYWFRTGLDNDGLRRGAREAARLLGDIGDRAAAEGSRIDAVYRRIAGAVGGYFSIAAAQGFISQIVKVRGEIQSLSTSFETLLGDKAKADALFSQIREFAVKTPMDMTDLAKGAQTLLGFNVEAEKVMPILRQIGDVSMGSADKFNALVLAFSQMSATGKLMGQDLLQMINAGFNPLAVISERTGESISSLKDKMSAGAISADMVAEAFRAATEEGGKFHGMLESQSKGITGSVATLTGAIGDMYNDLGTKSEGVISMTLGGLTRVVQHYEEIGKVLADIIVVYGAYRAAMAAAAAINTAVVAARHTAEAASLEKLLTVEQREIITKQGLSKASAEYAALVKAGVTANVQAAQAAAARATSESAAAAQTVTAKQAELAAAQQAVAAKQTELAAIRATGTARQIETAERSLATATVRMETAELAYNTAVREAGVKSLAAEEAARRSNTLTMQMNTAAQGANSASTNLLTAAKIRLKAATDRLNAAILKNPYVAAAAAMTALVYVLYKMVTAETAAETAQRSHTDAMEAAKKAKEDLISGAQRLIGVIKDENQTIYTQIQAWEDLKKAMPKAFGEMSMSDVKGMSSEELQKLINRAADDKERANFDAEFESARKRVEALKNEIRDTGANGGDSTVLMRELEVAKEVLAVKTKENEKREEMMRMAEFEGKSNAEKLTVLEEQLRKYREQYGEIERLYPDAEKIGQLEALNEEIRETEKRIEGVKKAVGKENAGKESYGAAYENAEKAWKEAKTRLEAIEREKRKFTIEQHEKAVAEEKAAKEKYESLGGDTKSGKKKEKKEKKDYTGQLESDGRDLVRMVTDMQHAETQAKIDAMEEGLDRTLAQRDLDHRKEIERLRRQEEDTVAELKRMDRNRWESENPDWESKGKKYAPSAEFEKRKTETGDAFGRMRAEADKKHAMAEQSVYKDELKRYEEFASNYISKADEFRRNLEEMEKLQAEKRKKLVAGGASKDDLKKFDEKTKTSLDAMRSAQTAILSRMDEEMGIKEEEFVAAVESIVLADTEALIRLLAETKKKMEEEVARGGGDKKRVGQLEAQINTLNERIADLQKLGGGKNEDPKPKGDPAKRWKDTLSVMKDVKGLTDDITSGFEGMDDATKAVLDAAMNIATGVVSMIIGITTLAVGSATTTTVVAGTAAEAIKGVERASVILAIIGAALQVAQAIGKLLTNLFSKDKKREKEIQALQGQVDALRVSYESLGNAIEKSYSTSAAKLIVEQEENLKRQRAAIERQIQLEEEKKKTDNNKVREYRDAIRTIDELLEQTNDRVVEAITGEGVQSAIEQFADAYMDAWSAGEDRAKAMRDVVREMIRSAVRQLANDRLKQHVEKFMNDLAEAMNDGVISASEQAMLDASEARMEAALADLDAKFGKYVKEAEEPEREAKAQGFATMSQDSADELNGRFTMIQQHTYRIGEDVRLLAGYSAKTGETVAGIRDAMATLTANCVQITRHLAGIESNTRYCERLEKIEAYMGAVRSGIDDMLLKGIKIRN